MRKCYLSKNYSNCDNAGNKAKTDIEAIIKDNGFINVGLKQSHRSNKVTGFLLTLCGVLKAIFTIKKGDLLLLQYPFKKYYVFKCCIAHVKGAKVVTVIHDLGSFRRKKLTVHHEIWKLNHSEYIIAHNDSMHQWLSDHGCKAQIIDLSIFDYLSEQKPEAKNTEFNHYRILYAGGLAKRKNAFLYTIGKHLQSLVLNIYGNGLDLNEMEGIEHVYYKGFMASDDLIKKAEGDFGLAWEGSSLSSCEGDFGEYVKYNNPHKVSLYIRCNLPIIIWSQAALAPFVEQNGIGISIDSLEDLEDKLKQITPEQYLSMKRNTEKISRNLSQGYYIMHALNQIP